MQLWSCFSGGISWMPKTRGSNPLERSTVIECKPSIILIYCNFYSRQKLLLYCSKESGSQRARQLQKVLKSKWTERMSQCSIVNLSMNNSLELSTRNYKSVKVLPSSDRTGANSCEYLKRFSTPWRKLRSGTVWCCHIHSHWYEFVGVRTPPIDAWYVAC